jgi:predicted ATPase/DNA-binding CsgD family transcriptional regulator
MVLVGGVGASISEREAEVLSALGERLTNAEIARRLHISVRTVESHVSALLRKLGARNRRELADISRRQRPDLTAPAAPPLPPRLNTFLGRDNDLATVMSLLEAARLVTLVGPAGVGKTRLAVETAARIEPALDGRVAFVDLSAAGDEVTVLGSFARSLGAGGERPGRLHDQMLREIKRDQVLVVDNCEHVMEWAAPLLIDLLSASDTLRVLATSREALAVPGECVFSVGPLESAAATALFWDRAKTVEASTIVNETASAAATSICRRLDGMPLAIELAAAQAFLLTPQQIEARLDDRFALLRAPTRGRSERHAALETAVRWSYDLLDPRERVLLDRLTVFRGRFELDAVEAVVPRPPVERRAVVELLGALVRKSLVVADQVGDQRQYRLLETIRDYGWDRLAAGGELEELRQRHADWIVGLLDRAVIGLHTDAQARWFERLDEALPNIEAALEWSLRTPEQARTVLDAVQGLRNYWLAGGVRRPAGLKWLRAAVDAASTVGPPARARALLDGVLLLILDDLDTATDLAIQAETVAGDDAIASAYAALAASIVSVHRGRSAEKSARAAIAALEQDDPLYWWAGGMLAFDLARRGHHAKAARQLRYVAAGFRALGDEHLADGALSYTADLMLAVGDASTARDDATRALGTARRFACASCESQALASLALIDRHRGLGHQLAASREALRLAHRIGETWNVLAGLDLVAGGLADAGRFDEAVVVGAAARKLRARTGYAPVLPARGAELERALASARAALDPLVAARLERDGAALDFEAAVILALG